MYLRGELCRSKVRILPWPFPPTYVHGATFSRQPCDWWAAQRQADSGPSAVQDLVSRKHLAFLMERLGKFERENWLGKQHC